MNKSQIDSLCFRINACCESVNWKDGKEFVVIDWEALDRVIENAKTTGNKKLDKILGKMEYHIENNIKLRKPSNKSSR